MDILLDGPAPVNARGPTAAEAAAVAALIGHPPENAPAKKRRTRRDLYRPLDIHRAKAEAWPERLPPLSPEEALKAGRLLYRRFYQRRWYEERGRKVPKLRSIPVKLTSGNRNSWAHRGELRVNAGKGWRELVHDLSHYFHWRLRPRDPAHSDNHRHLEKEMIAHVVGSGWLDGQLRRKPQSRAPAKPKPDPKILAHDRVLDRIKSWETKLKRATNALAKLRKEERRLRRQRPIFTLAD